MTFSSHLSPQSITFNVFVILEVIQLRNPKSDRHLCIAHLTLFVRVCGWRFGTSCHRAIASWVPQTDGASFFLKSCSCPPRDVMHLHNTHIRCHVMPKITWHRMSVTFQDKSDKIISWKTVWMRIDTHTHTQTNSHTCVSNHERFVWLSKGVTRTQLEF